MTPLIESILDHKIAFIGGGNMASAIIAGLVKSGLPATQIMASNPTQDKLDKLVSNYGLLTTRDNLEAAEFAKTVIFAVKPQKLAGVCSELAACDFTDKLVISVAAGFRVEQILAGLNQRPSIIRAMPNTPALIGQGATGLFATERVSEKQRNLAQAIFGAIGTHSWLTQESQIDVVTAIAGSSPAYVFLLMQAMLEQAVESGLPESDAFNLITQAVAGAAQLAQVTPEKSLQTLRQEVTSPGGTTAAAINSFMNDNFELSVKKAVRASILRGHELGNLHPNEEN